MQKQSFGVKWKFLINIGDPRLRRGNLGCCWAVLALLVVSCSAKPESNKVGELVATDADWQVHNRSLYNKGKVLPLGKAIEEWEEILGQHDRFVNFMYVFDRHGLKLYERDGVIVTMVLVYKNRPAYEINSEENDSMRSFYQSANDARPGLEYQRSVNIEGGIVKPKMSMEEFNRQRRAENPEANLFTEAYLPTIYHLYRHCNSEKTSLNYVGMRIEFQVGSTTDVQQFAFGGEVR